MCCNRLMPLDPLDLAAIGTDLKRLTDLVRTAEMQLPGPAADEFADERDEILLTFDGYLEPRIGAPDAPIVAAIVGPSGVGKSTLLNSIAGARIATTGVIRPTTRYPLVWADALQSEEYWAEFSTRVANHLGPRVDSVMAGSHMTEHLTIIDTPPLESYEAFDLPAQAVALADLCIFVTSPTRYADGRAWDFLRHTRRRGIPILFVLNRLPPNLEEQEAILHDFAERLHQRELLGAADPSLLFALAEGEIEPDTSGLAIDAVSSIRKELAEVADPVYRQGLVDETVYATARMVAERSRALTRPMAAEQPVVERLLISVAHAYEVEARILDAELRSGALAPDDPYADWQTAAKAVAGVVARRAGSAAHVAASAWSEQAEAADIVGDEGAELWRHDRTTTNAAMLALDSWKAGLGALAVTHSRSGRLRWGSGPRTVAALWRSVLYGSTDLPRRVQRKFPDGGQEMLETARVEFSEAMRRGLAHDGERFTSLIGSDTADDLYSAIVDRADLVDARLDSLAAQIPRSWIEQVDDDVEVVTAPDTVLAIHISESSTVVELAPEEPDPPTGGTADPAPDGIRLERSP